MSQAAAKPLFLPKTLKQALENFRFPDDIQQRHQVILRWIKTLKRGTLDEVKETSLHGDFLKDIFQSILGYRSVVEGEGQQWELHAEQTISDGGGSADGALGFFTASMGKKGAVKLAGRVIAPIELKGAKNDLDRAASGRKESAVDQGWRYANYTADCRWVIVSNYREIRLYQTSKTPAYYEVFRLSELEDFAAFQSFYFVLCRQNFLPPSPDIKKQSAIDQLLLASDKAEIDITETLYQEYKQVRINLATHFRNTGPEDLANRDIILIEKAQKTLDRILFIAFCEDKQLLPQHTIKKAHDHKDPYNPRSIWDNFKSVFQSVDQGNDALSIPGYNGGLFKHDPLLDGTLTVSDELCTQLKKLERYDFESEISVNILGHIFEQSVTDLEELRALSAGESFDRKKGKRKTQGVYYTPAFITQYIVEVALGGYLKRKEKALWEEMEIDQIRKNAVKKRQMAEVKFWERYRDQVLRKTRVIDPACGSGAFLIAAFDYLSREYERVNEQLAALKIKGESGEFVGQRSVFDLTKTILNEHLYGVDLSPESVEITKLSLWLKTAERGKQLTYLDDNIKVGNSIIADPTVDPLAFDWNAAFPDVFADGGFDVVIGNPPYVRQELLTPFKPYLQDHYQSYDGVADLYVYFYEKGLNILRSNGLLSYIVTNKWLRAGYGEPLRKFFSENSVFEQIIDFGHAPIFQDADVFPCIVSVRKPENEETDKENLEDSESVRICPIERESLERINLPQHVNQEGYSVPWQRFDNSPWSLERTEVGDLIVKVEAVGIPLKELISVKPYRGVYTGYNPAFYITDDIKNQILKDDPNSIEVIKPYFRGQDIKRWSSEWKKLWLIFAKWDFDIEQYPAIASWLSTHKEALEKRPEVKQGRYPWYALSRYAAEFWELFQEPKIMIQRIAFHPRISFDGEGIFINDSAIMLPSTDYWALACLNSPIAWYYCFRNFPHKKDEAIAMDIPYVEALPTAPPTEEIRAEVEPAVQRLIDITKANQGATRDVLDWLQLEHGIEKPGNKLSDFATLTFDDFHKEVKKRRPKAAGNLGPKDLKTLKEAYGDYAHPVQDRRAEGLKLEHRISNLVNQAYGLTPEEIDLMWKTAPPRMPFARPDGG
ncbi:MAG: DNA methyltransferase [Leptolyngbyaceae bacterium]|nr:DNA methyltransferase [Leptolyngbyaceae bacterium]